MDISKLTTEERRQYARGVLAQHKQAEIDYPETKVVRGVLKDCRYCGARPTMKTYTHSNEVGGEHLNIVSAQVHCEACDARGPRHGYTFRTNLPQIFRVYRVGAGIAAQIYWNNEERTNDL